jgi:hypothetical protein
MVVYKRFGCLDDSPLLANVILLNVDESEQELWLSCPAFVG